MIAYYSTFKKHKNTRFCRVANEIKSFDNSDEETCTDTSHYRPSAPAFAQVSGNTRTGLYDYPDGIENGIDVSFLRQRGLDDLEVQAFIDRLEMLSTEQIKELIQSDNVSKINKERKEMNEKTNKALDSLINQTYSMGKDQ